MRLGVVAQRHHHRCVRPGRANMTGSVRAVDEAVLADGLAHLGLLQGLILRVILRADLASFERRVTMIAARGLRIWVL